MNRPLFQLLAGRVQARENCRQSGNTGWHGRHEDSADQLVKQFLPSGSGFDSGTTLDWDKSKPDRLVFCTSFHHMNDDEYLVFCTSFHHMNDDGYYDGWTEHTVIVTPSMVHGFEIRVTGRDRRNIKDYVAEMFQSALSADVDDSFLANVA